MIRPIDANLLKENLLNQLSVRSEEYFLVLERFIRRVIDEQPTVDAKPVVYAHWVEHEWAEEVEGFLISNYECSNCHWFVRSSSNYCPDCGAKMGEVTE